MTLADRVVVMNGGTIEQVGTPHEIYHRPRTRFVAGFIGSPAMNFMPCRLEQQRRGPDACGCRTSWPCRCRPIAPSATASSRQGAACLGLRPEHITEPRGADADSAANSRLRST